MIAGRDQPGASLNRYDLVQVLVDTTMMSKYLYQSG